MAATRGTGRQCRDSQGRRVGSSSMAFRSSPPAIFEIGRRSAHHRDETLEHLGNRLAAPARGHRDADTVGTLERGGAGGELMVMGIEG